MCSESRAWLQKCNLHIYGGPVDTFSDAYSSAAKTTKVQEEHRTRSYSSTVYFELATGHAGGC